jgi:glycosyltransferase involved in cell wall biosynthesis
MSLLFVGAFHLDPANADGIVYFSDHVMPLIHREHPKATLTIVGPYPPPEVQQLASRPGVTVTGYVDDVRPYFTHASVLILPLRAGAGTKVRIFTAMAMGKPVVATPVGAEGIDARFDEGIIIAELPTEFGDRVSALLGDPTRRMQLGRTAREAAAARYDWRVSGRKLEQFYRSLVEARAG